MVMDVMRYANYNLHLLQDGEKEKLIDELNFLRQHNPTSCQSYIEELNQYGLYPVWNMVGYRNTYHFPTESDCIMWEDYLFSMREDE